MKIPSATIAFSVTLRFTHSNYPFVIFKLFVTDCWKHLQWDLIMFRCIFKRLSIMFGELDGVHFRAVLALRQLNFLSDNVVSLFVDSVKTLNYRPADKTNWINLSHRKMSKNEKCSHCVQKARANNRQTTGIILCFHMKNNIDIILYVAFSDAQFALFSHNLKRTRC